MSMIYVASPYTANPKKNLQLIEDMFWDTIMLRDLVVYSPIVYMARMAQARRAPVEAEPYESFNFNMLASASAFWICALPGWTTSSGVQQEYGWAQDFRLPCTIVDAQGRLTDKEVPALWHK